MGKSAAEPIVLILSEDKDFTIPLAEQIENILQLPCETAENYAAAQPLKSAFALVVSTSSVTDDCLLPIITVKPPLRMVELLRDIITAIKRQSSDEISLGQDYILQPRQKELVHKPSGKTAALTDKEVQLLQQLLSGAMSKEQLLKQVWGVEAVLETHTLETHIYRLRAKLRELNDEEGLIVAAGGGYRLKVD